MPVPIVKDLASLAYQDILKRRKTSPFLIFVSFIFSFILARLMVLNFDVELIIRQYHIHHFYYGIFFISVAAWIGLVSQKARLIVIGSLLFGAGLGLIADEVGLLLTCNTEGLECDYFARGSYDTAVILGLVFFAAMYFPPFWFRIKKRASGILRR